MLHFNLSILLFVVFSINDSCLYSQTILQGKVSDKESSETVPFASVAIYSNGVLINGTDTDFDGNYLFSNIEPGTYEIEAAFLGYATSRITDVVIHADSINVVNFLMVEEGTMLEEVIVTTYKVPFLRRCETSTGGTVKAESIKSLPSTNINALAATTAGLSTVNGSDISVIGCRSNSAYVYIDGVRVKRNKIKKLTPQSESLRKSKRKAKREYKRGDESYNHFVENAFTQVANSPLSTFSIDVDRASYSNIRRIVNQGSLPPVDAVRIEEMINYFDYDIYAEANDHPIGMSSTLTECPWNKKHQLLHLSMNADKLDTQDLKPSNFVFLVDVSGSMGSPNKLPLVIESLELLVEQMQPNDRISIVTYAGRSAIALPSTPVKEKSKILTALQNLRSGGSTAGAEGIKTAYTIAKDNLMKKGNNRVILATDGDFNVGVSTEAGLEDLIVEYRDLGIFLTVLGYGMGNYKDDKMQLLANKGNGNHGYIDNIKEAKKLFITEYTGTLYTVAKDVKIQIEFNPAVVETYRLIGYENRLLATEDFDDDKKDAGEIGAGHHVTALYEIIPVGTKSKYNKEVAELKYTDMTAQIIDETEVCTINMRYKEPKKDKSIKFEIAVANTLLPIQELSAEAKFALGVAQCGLLLRESEYIEDGSYKNVMSLIQDGLANDPYEERAEFKKLVTSIQAIDNSTSFIDN